VIDWKKLIAGMIIFFVCIIVLYIIFIPNTLSSAEQGKINLFVSSVCCTSTIIMLGLLFVVIEQQKSPEIISPFDALADLSIKEQKQFKIKDIAHMIFFKVHPVGDGKRSYLEYYVDDGMFAGHKARMVINCVSDKKYLPTDMNKKTRVEGFNIDPMTAADAKRLLAAKTVSPLEKVQSAAQVIKKIDEKGGPTASELAQDILEKEKYRNIEEEE